MVRLLIALVLLLATGCGAHNQGSKGDLLYGRMPVHAAGVRGTAKLTDGAVDVWGDDWRSRSAVIFGSSRAYVEYDLGRITPIGAAYIQGDANDFYTLSVSDDGVHFKPLWSAKPASETGLQSRWAANLRSSGRYVRLAASGGDGRYSVSEVAIYQHTPRTFPPDFRVQSNAPPAELLRSSTLVFGLALVLFLLLAIDRSKWWWTALALAIPVYAGARWLMALHAAWPVEPREVSLLRAVVAAVGIAAVMREVFSPASWPANRRAVVGTLAVCGVLAAACFANLGRAQYIDHENNAPGYVHNFDMRVYYPVAKYFNELSFTGLYDGSVAAYVADDPNVTLKSLGNVPLRDLHSHAVVHVSDVVPQIRAIKKRFSPARWKEFVADMRYFRLNMGTRDYLGSMQDHGGNATPAWFVIPHLIFSHTHASNRTLLATALLDPLLLTIAFVAIARTFGIRTMLVALIVYGATDFYMFGTDWFGSTLRQDWMAYLALGVCALKTRRFKLGGGLLGMSAMMRAFPLFALIGAAIPAMWWLWNETAKNRALPRWQDIVREQRPILEVAAGALVVAAVMFVVSSILFSPGSWIAWFKKVEMLNASPHLNHISLRGFLGGTTGADMRLLRERMPIYIACIGGFAIMVGLAGRSRPLHQAALLGLVLVPVLFNPANYYSHLVFLYPLLAVELRDPSGKAGTPPVSRRDAGIWLVWLGVCATQYGTVLVPDLGLHFGLATALLFVALVMMLLLLIVPDADAVPHTLALAAAGPAGILESDAPAPASAPGERSSEEAPTSSDDEEGPTSSDDEEGPPTSSDDEEGPPTSSDDKEAPPTSTTDEEAPTGTPDEEEPPTSAPGRQAPDEDTDRDSGAGEEK